MRGCLMLRSGRACGYGEMNSCVLQSVTELFPLAHRVMPQHDCVMDGVQQGMLS